MAGRLIADGRFQIAEAAWPIREFDLWAIFFHASSPFAFTALRRDKLAVRFRVALPPGAGSRRNRKLIGRVATLRRIRPAVAQRQRWRLDIESAMPSLRERARQP